MALNYFLIGLGGALGAITRVAMGKLLPLAILGVPTYILFINIIGCFFMGIISEALALYGTTTTAGLHYLLVSGFLGGFTTFSAFAFEFALLYEKNEYLLALIYILLSVGLSLIAFFFGAKAVQHLT